MYTIGVDIGGMSVKVGLVDDNGHIIAVNRKKTEKNPDIMVEILAGQINELLKDNNLTISELRGVGIGCPGSVTGATGVIEFSNNLDWRKVPLKDMLQKYINTEVRISNDANVAALGEATYGVAKNYSSSIMFTLGTGVGGGIIIDDKLYEGNESKGAELGHTTLILDGEKCTCGRRGCVEAYVSATALIRQTKEAMKADKDSKMWDFVDGDINKVDGRTAFETAKLGDKSAELVRDNYVKYLAESMMNMFNIFRPQAFILGGGVSAQGEYLTSRLKGYCEKMHYGYEGTPKVEILIATLGNDAGIIGAAALLK